MRTLKQATLILGLVVAQLLACSTANAHFLFVYSEDGKVKVVFREDLDPDQAQFLSGLKAMKAFTTIDGEKKEITFEKVVEGDNGWFEVAKDGVGNAVDISCPYGVFGRDDKTMFLDYSAKYVQHMHGKPLSKPTKEMALDLVPEFGPEGLKVTVLFKGMPLHNAEVKLVRVETDSVETKTDETGSIVLSPTARYLVRAKHVLEEAGEIDGKKFSERRYYCTMVLDVGAK